MTRRHPDSVNLTGGILPTQCVLHMLQVTNAAARAREAAAPLASRRAAGSWDGRAHRVTERTAAGARSVSSVVNIV